MPTPGIFFLMSDMVMKKAVIFIDGNNFYHGMKKIGLSSREELDYEEFSRKITGESEWVETRYYIGKVRQEGDISHYIRQQKFFSFLKKLEKVNYYTGRMEIRPKGKVDKKLSNWISALDKRMDANIPNEIVDELRGIAGMDAVQYTEKAVDVMIAVDMVSMAHMKKYDVAYLVTTDGDFTPAVKEVRATGRKVFVASPVKGYQISQVANAFIPLTQEFFDGCWL